MIRPRYLSYLVRLWQVGDDERLVWRAMVENPHTRERLGFTSLEQVVAFLAEEMHRAEDEDRPPNTA